MSFWGSDGSAGGFGLGSRTMQTLRARSRCYGLRWKVVGGQSILWRCALKPGVSGALCFHSDGAHIRVPPDSLSFEKSGPTRALQEPYKRVFD